MKKTLKIVVLTVTWLVDGLAKAYFYRVLWASRQRVLGQEFLELPYARSWPADVAEDGR